MPYIKKPAKIQKNNSFDFNSKLRHKIYNDSRWVRLREVKLMKDPLCELCLKEGKYTPAIDVHHITSFMKGNSKQEVQTLAFDYSNLMSLCKVHHQLIHNSNKGYGV